MKRFLLILTFSLSCWSLMAQGYRPGPVNYHDYQVTHLKNAQALPSRYDAREHGIESPVRDQKIGGPCWAFAACEAVYSTFTSQGLKVEPYTPQILANCHEPFLFEPMAGGGNDQVAIALFSRGDGPIAESLVPFDAQDPTCPAYAPEDIDYYALGAQYLPADDKQVIKEEILKHGAVVAGMYYDDASYNPTTYFHEYTGDQGSNHGVTIIGWDDEIGAWLVKNSWGEKVHDHGYLWVSYKDVNIAKTCVSYTQGVSTQEIDNIYTYSLGGMTGAFGASDKDLTISGIVSFNAPEEETINYIGSYVNLAGTDLTFNVIYKGQIITLSEPIHVPYIGYYVYALPEPITVTGEYKVAVDYHHDNGGFVLPTNGRIQNYVDCKLVPGKQWLQFKGWNWEPVGGDENPYNLCIYAYTQDKNTTAVQETEAEKNWALATQIIIYNLVGQIVKTCPIVPGTSNLSEWMQQNPLELPQGTYIVKVVDQANHSYTQKMVL